jgi:hypothetical protein
MVLFTKGWVGKSFAGRFTRVDGLSASWERESRQGIIPRFPQTPFHQPIRGQHFRATVAGAPLSVTSAAPGMRLHLIEGCCHLGIFGGVEQC